MEDQDLITAFEQGLVDGAEFPHERRVRVARGLAQRYGHEDGLRRLIAGLRGMLARAGHAAAYHETITRAWYELITSAKNVASTPELFDKRLLARYYSSDRLAAGRHRWLEPDLHPLRLPPPPPPASEPEGVRRFNWRGRPRHPSPQQRSSLDREVAHPVSREPLSSTRLARQAASLGRRNRPASDSASSSDPNLNWTR